MNALNSLGTNPPLQFVDATQVRVGGRALLYFAGSNYLGLSFHPAVRRAMATAALRGPLHPGSSRATTGEQTAYRRFEHRLARYFRVEDSACVAAGYLAPIAACQALRGVITQVLLDDRAHACVADGAQLTGAPVIGFPHADARALTRELKKLPRSARPLVACDGAFGTRGGLTPVNAYVRVLPRDTLLLVDDAHGAGTVGPGGRGVCALLQIKDRRVIQTISLAKAFGVAGGAVLGTSEFAARLRTTAAGFIGSTSPLLPAIAALDAALGVFLGQPRLVTRLQANARLLHDLLPRTPEVSSDPRTPIFGVFPSSVRRAQALRRTLLGAGIFPPFIRYLSGPAEGFFRFSVSARHTPAQVRRLASAIRYGLNGRLL